MQHEFVHALLRLGVIRARALRSSSASCLGSCLTELVRHTQHFIAFDLCDDLSAKLKSRMVKAVRYKYEHKLGAVFEKFAKDSASTRRAVAPT